jgi:sulfur relay (sulfurtransferase) DsrC/TusE family protein
MENRTPIYLTDEEVEMWKFVREYYDDFSVLKDMKLARMIFDANNAGKIKSQLVLNRKEDIKKICNQ